MRTSRLEAFSDGVLAIIITIMVLELREPDGQPPGGPVARDRPRLLSYLLSFVYVGIYWTNHHHMFQLTARVTGGDPVGEPGLLFFLSLFPFTTQWMDTTHFAAAPVVVYGVNLLTAARRLLHPAVGHHPRPGPRLGAAPGDRQRPQGQGLPGPLHRRRASRPCSAAAGTGWNRPGIWIAVACYVGAALLWVIPDRRIERKIEAITAEQAAPATPGTASGPDPDRQR